jgi:hypothetical protein
MAAGRSKAVGNVTPCSAAQGGIVVPGGVEGVLVVCESQADLVRTRTGDVMQRVVPRKKSNERDVDCRLQCRGQKTSEERAGRVRSASRWWVCTGSGGCRPSEQVAVSRSGRWTNALARIRKRRRRPSCLAGTA